MTKQEASTVLRILRAHGNEGVMEQAEGHFYVVATDCGGESETLWTRAQMAAWLGY